MQEQFFSLATLESLTSSWNNHYSLIRFLRKRCSLIQYIGWMTSQWGINLSNWLIEPFGSAVSW